MHEPSCVLSDAETSRWECPIRPGRRLCYYEEFPGDSPACRETLPAHLLPVPHFPAGNRHLQAFYSRSVALLKQPQGSNQMTVT